MPEIGTYAYSRCFSLEHWRTAYPCNQVSRPQCWCRAPLQTCRWWVIDVKHPHTLANPCIVNDALSTLVHAQKSQLSWSRYLLYAFCLFRLALLLPGLCPHSGQREWAKIAKRGPFFHKRIANFCRIAKTPIAPFMAIVVAPKPGFSPRAWSSAFGCKESILVLLQKDE